MKDTVRDQMIETWKLESYVENLVDGFAPVYPMGERPMGSIMCPSDGYIWAQLLRAGRPNFASSDWFNGTTEEYREEASTYIADSAVNGDDVKGQ
ncbi:MAG: lipocalin-like domain-containing protein [Nitrospira sp.]